MNIEDFNREEFYNDKDNIKLALDYIIEQTQWADKFPRQCHERIRKVCNAIKDGKILGKESSNQSEIIHEHQFDYDGGTCRKCGKTASEMFGK